MQSTPPLFSALMTESAALAADTCGPDLEYVPRFLDFMASANGKEEQQFGATIIAAQDPDWRVVLKSGMVLAQESRDLRIATVLTRAAVEINGLPGLVDGLTLIHDWLSSHWEMLHPALSIDGEYDPLLRVNALAYLYAPGACLKAIKQVRLLTSPIGDLSVRDAHDIVKGLAINNTVVTSSEQLARLIIDGYERNRATLVALQQAIMLQQKIESIWKSKLPSEYWPTFDNLHELLDPLAALITAAQSTTTDASRPPDRNRNTLAPSNMNVNMQPVSHNTGVSPMIMRVNSRGDAFRALAVVRQYFEYHEPSHPAPLLIKRIEKLETLNFSEILSELTPDALGQLRQIAGQTTS